MPVLLWVLTGSLCLVVTGGTACSGPAQARSAAREGPYEAITRKDWQTFPDKEALEGLFGVEGGLNDCRGATEPSPCSPHLPVTDFYDLVPDPLFGKVVRYNGGPRLNPRRTDMPGRTALHGEQLRGEYTHVWVRQFIRFSPNFTTGSRTGGQGAASYKVMFLRYRESSARHQFVLDGPRGVNHDGGSPEITRVTEGILPWHNVMGINQQYRTEGWPWPDAFPMIRVPGPPPAAPSGAPYGTGDGEWYEVVLHHLTRAERGEFTMYWRRYTSRGAASPGPWKIDARYIVGRSGQVYRGVTVYTMGINRNRQYDEDMYVYWGPFEVVDGSKYPNPWNLPGG